MIHNHLTLPTWIFKMPSTWVDEEVIVNFHSDLQRPFLNKLTEMKITLVFQMCKLQSFLKRKMQLGYLESQHIYCKKYWTLELYQQKK